MVDVKKILDTVAMFLTGKVLPAAVLAALGVPVIRGVMGLICRLLERSRLEKVAHGLIKTVTKVVLYGLLGLMLASSLGIDVTGIVALASVLTLAVSLSVQNALTNLISGFTLLYTKPFASGDLVEIAGQSGTVTEIGLTYTRLTAPDSKTISIPNGSVTAAQIVNYTALGTRRVEITVRAAYDSSVDAVLAALLQAAKVPTALTAPAPFAAVQGYQESAVEYILLVWTAAQDYWTTLFAVNKRVGECFLEKGVCMTYPHVNVHLTETGNGKKE